MSIAAPPLVDVSSITRLVGKAALRIGQDYARDDKIAGLWWEARTGVLSGTVTIPTGTSFSCSVELRVSASGSAKPSSSRCECVEGADCRHVAGLIISGNMRTVQQANAEERALQQAFVAASPAYLAPDSAATENENPENPEPEEPQQASWKTELARLRQAPADPHARPPRAMALLFELREQTPRTPGRWRGPTARPARPSPDADRGADDTHYKLGVRPVVQSESGNWVRAKIGWSNLPYQSSSAHLNEGHHLWFSQFAALHRPVREVYYGHDADWLYLDDFQSPLLWRMFEQTSALGIELVAGARDESVRIAGLAELSLDAAARGDEIELSGAVSIDGEGHPIGSVGSIGNHGVYSYGLESPAFFVLAPTGHPLGEQHHALLARPASLIVPAGDVAEFLGEYYPSLHPSLTITSTDASVQFPEIVAPTLVLTASFRAQHSLILLWEHEDRGQRRAVTELELAALVPTVGPLSTERTTLKGLAAAEFAEYSIPLIEALDGVRVDIVGARPDYRELHDTPELRVRTIETDQRDWFDLGVIVTVGGYDIPFGPLFRALAQDRAKLLLVDGSYLSLRQPQFDRLRDLIAEAKELAEWETGLRISRYQASLWADFEDLADHSAPALSWKAAVDGLLATNEIEPTPLPSGLNAELRPYQREGFEWLAFLYEHRLGGILADDMGLGKTLQTLALLLHASQQPGERTPFLVVAPTSVVSNWLIEAARFTPGLRVVGVTATEAKSATTLRDAAAGADVIVTSYALFRLDYEAYRAQPWAGLILDEAQFVKNHTAKIHQCARDLGTDFTLAITGTPLENRLMELWSLFSIVAPGLFASARKFTEDYVRPIERGEDGRLELLRRRIRPLMMRRTKDLVAAELPAKQEQLLSVELHPRHQKIYDTFLQRERQKLFGLIDDVDKNRMIIFRSLTLLRMLSLDASLVDEKYSAAPSSKLDVLMEQLGEAVAEGHRSLIFSQFTSYLQKAAVRLDEQGIEYVYLDGSTRKRAEAIASFKNGSAPVFLISLKAGGFGLNLTEADYVFLLDPWWNPATETQAIDRTHRIGQDKSVLVYRMIAAGTIEEKVMALKEKKAKLFSAVMDDDAVFSAALTADDIRSLLSDSL